MATFDIQLITENEVKTLTSLTGNVDIKKFIHHIAIQQDIVIKRTIGTSCYADLLDGVENDDLTALELTLLNGDDRNFKGIKPALAWWVLYASYPDLYINITGAGMGKKIGTGFEGITTNDLNLKRDQAKNYAEHYTDQLVCYICENEDDYPCYAEADCSCSPLIKEGYDSNSGIALDNHELIKRNPELDTVRAEGAKRPKWLK